MTKATEKQNTGRGAAAASDIATLVRFSSEPEDLERLFLQLMGVYGRGANQFEDEQLWKRPLLTYQSDV